MRTLFKTPSHILSFTPPITLCNLWCRKVPFVWQNFFAKLLFNHLITFQLHFGRERDRQRVVYRLQKLDTGESEAITGDEVEFSSTLSGWVVAIEGEPWEH